MRQDSAEHKDYSMLVVPAAAAEAVVGADTAAAADRTAPVSRLHTAVAVVFAAVGVHHIDPDHTVAVLAVADDSTEGWVVGSDVQRGLEDYKQAEALAQQPACNHSRLSASKHLTSPYQTTCSAGTAIQLCIKQHIQLLTLFYNASSQHDIAVN